MHSSQNRSEGMIDAQLFFPEMFKVNFMTLMHLPSLMFLKQRPLIERRLEDTLMNNEYRLLTKQELQITKDQLVDKLKDVFSNSIPLATYLLSDPNLRITVAGKVGPNKLNDFGANLESYLKVTAKIL